MNVDLDFQQIVLICWDSKALVENPLANFSLRLQKFESHRKRKKSILIPLSQKIRGGRFQS